MRTSGKTNSPLASPVYIGQAQGEEEKTYKKRSFELLFVSFGSACTHASRVYFPLLAIKTAVTRNCNIGLSTASNFCSGETELRKLQTSLTILPCVVQFSSVTQSRLTLCDPMNCSTPDLPVHHQLPEFTQIHVHQVGDAIQPSHPLLSPSPPAPNPSQHQGLFQ